MNKFEVKELTYNKEWLGTYITNVTGQEVISIEEFTYLPLCREEGKVLEVKTEDYWFSFYFVEEQLFLRDGEHKVVVENLDELDRIINKQFMEYFQV